MKKQYAQRADCFFTQTKGFLIKKNPTTQRLAIFLRNAKSGYSLKVQGETQMSRNKENIKMQLNRRLNELLRIWHKNQPETRGMPNYNPTRSEGVRSILTADTYRKSLNVFGDYCKTQNIRSIDQIDEKVVEGFLQSRRNLSGSTISKDLSSINKVLGSNYTPGQFGFAKRTADKIVHNRGILTANSTAKLDRNQAALWFAYATGCRRSSILTTTADKAIRDEHGSIIGFEFREKGGRCRNAFLLPPEQAKMTAYVDGRIAALGANCRLIDSCDSSCNPHFQRGLYAQELYQEMKAAKDDGRDIYNGHRDIFVNQELYERAVSRYKSDTVCNYDAKICAEISQSMGHNRISVVIESYLRK